MGDSSPIRPLVLSGDISLALDGTLRIKTAEGLVVDVGETVCEYLDVTDSEEHLARIEVTAANKG